MTAPLMKMSKRAWKDHVALGITSAEYIALNKVFDILRKTTLDKRDKTVKGKSPLFFDMDTCAQPHYCGTASCIGGHMAILMNGSHKHSLPLHSPAMVNIRNNIENYVYEGRSNSLYELFSPTYTAHDQFGWSDITPRMAIYAINNFMRTGLPDWDAAIELAEQDTKEIV